LGEDEAILTSIFFKGVGSTTNQKKDVHSILTKKKDQKRYMPHGQRDKSFVTRSNLIVHYYPNCLNLGQFFGIPTKIFPKDVLFSHHPSICKSFFNKLTRNFVNNSNLQDHLSIRRRAEKMKAEKAARDG